MYRTDLKYINKYMFKLIYSQVQINNNIEKQR